MTIQDITQKRKIIFVVIALAIAGFGLYLFITRHDEKTDDAAIEAHVVTISPKVGGYVRTLHVTDNQLVKAGDVVLEIDPVDYQNRRDKAAALLEAAEARYQSSSHSLEQTRVSAPSGQDSAQSEVDSAQANWKKASDDLNRLQKLNSAARSKQQLDNAVAAEKSARAELQSANARLRTANTAPATVAVAQSATDAQAAELKQAKADLAQAEQDLQDTRIIAPEDGVIANRGVEQGDYVEPGQALLSIVGTEKWVIANYKETQIHNMRPGQPVSIDIDAFPGHDFTGRVDSIQPGTGARFSAFPPENATGNFVKIVQRVPVKILFSSAPDAALPLGPGMSVIATVHTE